MTVPCRSGFERSLPPGRPTTVMPKTGDAMFYQIYFHLYEAAANGSSCHARSLP